MHFGYTDGTYTSYFSVKIILRQEPLKFLDNLCLTKMKYFLTILVCSFIFFTKKIKYTINIIYYIYVLDS